MSPPRAAGWWVAAAAVMAGSLLLHLPVSDLFDGLARRYGFTEYDLATRAVFLAAGLAIAWWLWRAPAPSRAAVRRAALCLAAVIAVAQALLAVNGIEAIHYPQYALLSWVLVRARLPWESAWVLATGLGAVDELWQWGMLQRAVPGYLDWNDVVLNGVGAALGVLMTARLAGAAGRGPLVRGRVVAVSIGVAALGALAAGPLVTRPFYRPTPGGRWFHLLSPFEAVVVLAVCWGVVRTLRAVRPDPARYVPAAGP